MLYVDYNFKLIAVPLQRLDTWDNKTLETIQTLQLSHLYHFAEPMLHCLHASVTVCVCFMLLIHVHLKPTPQAFDWLSLGDRMFYLDLFAYSF